MQYVASVYSFILGGSPDSKLFMNVREKNSLCYSISSVISPVTNSMFIYAGIDKKDYKKVLKETINQIDAMSRGEFDLEDIESAKITYKCGLKEIYDSLVTMASNIASQEYLMFDSLEDRIKKIDMVTKDDIIKLSKKIKLDSVYLLKGVLDENN